MKRIKAILAVIFISALAIFLCACFSERESGDASSAPELTLGALTDYSDAHAEDAPYIVFSSDLEPIAAERIEEVRQAFYRMIYKNEVDAQTAFFEKTESEGIDIEIESAAQNSAVELALRGKSTLLNRENLEIDDSLSYVNLYTSRYYGTVGGCEIISIHSFTEKESVITLGGVDIKNSTPFYVFVCRGEEMIPLAEAYEKEWLTAIDVLLISKRNSDFNSYWKANYADKKTDYSYVKFTDDLEDLSDEMIAEIEACMYTDAYEERYNAEFENYTERYGGIYSEEKIDATCSWFAAISGYTSHDYFMENSNSDLIGWRYYGIVSVYAVFAKAGPSQAVTRFELGGNEIVFGTGSEMWVYSRDSGIVEIKEAYEKGLLTDADIAKIAERHGAYEDYIVRGQK